MARKRMWRRRMEQAGIVLRLPTHVVIAAIALVVAWQAFAESDFYERLARVDEAIRTNPSHVPEAALDSCLTRRNHAMQLDRWGEHERAERSIKYCFEILKISETPPPEHEKKQVAVASMEAVQAQAAAEVEQALHLTPDTGKGLEIYRTCAMCHAPEGWGLPNGSVPQIAGQHRTVVIKQLADIRAGNRDNFLMLPYSSVESMGGTQSVADVAAYIDTLEISIDNDKGPGTDLEFGSALYRDNCVRCHGERGEGDAAAFVPRIQSQHYRYLVNQFEKIRDGKRRNTNKEMSAQIQEFGERETHAVLDWVSRLEPPAALQAPPGWKNPDFAR